MNGFGKRRIWNAVVCIGLMVALSAAGGTLTLAAAEKKESGTAQVDLNSASREQLMQVKGIGPALADRIVEFRKEHGPFRRVEDILKVRGVGEKSLAKLRPHLKVDKSGT
ncbi:MAG: helix-hairpin-helix domain-containing protein [Acidobacteria bacterium]|uniref:Helix-hairpin-helix domain-containing protein n=1 Tax=Candidatus Polarisedimenticola svalbardensis TaxID=2886004 RepID=A0A8J6Y171_9BACT|nr:helix-hairpin-helix domain-containing protein [Candidatus Polarisedimenticola svalbardensis]